MQQCGITLSKWLGVLCPDNHDGYIRPTCGVTWMSNPIHGVVVAYGLILKQYQISYHMIWNHTIYLSELATQLLCPRNSCACLLGRSPTRTKRGCAHVTVWWIAELSARAVNEAWRFAVTSTPTLNWFVQLRQTNKQTKKQKKNYCLFR